MNDPGSIVVWCLVLVALLIALCAAVLWLRKWQQQEDVSVGAGFTLSDLRQLQREGHMSQEEFERAKAKIVQAAQRPPVLPTAQKPPKDR